MAASLTKMKTLVIDDTTFPAPTLTLAPMVEPVAAPFALNKSADSLKLAEGQVVVVKFGGNAIGDEQVLDALVDDTIALANAGVHVIVVHGGGTAVNDALSAIGKKTEKVNGLRVTDSETLSVAVDIFTGINEYLSEKFRQKGANALSFCSKSANPFLTEKMELVDKPEGKVDLGWVGEIVGVDAGMLESWVYAGWIPIVSPLGMDAVGHFYNINADHAALALATCMQADGLIFMTDVPGLLEDCHDSSSRIGHVTPQAAQTLIDQGTVSGGMLPKIKSCVSAINNGVDRIAILNSFEPHALLNGFIMPEEIGTLITGDNDEN